MTDVTELQPHQRAWTLDDTPCPRCGRTGFVMGYQLIDTETGKHQHTHYVCTAWPYPEPACGWHGWRADQPEVEPEHKLDDEFAKRVDAALRDRGFTLDRRQEINLMLHRPGDAKIILDAIDNAGYDVIPRGQHGTGG